MSRCLITGCALVGHEWVWGDLHKVGRAYVFNACLNEDGEAAWQQEGRPTDGRLSIMASKFFERRGVIVIAEEDAILSAEALDYVEKWK